MPDQAPLSPARSLYEELRGNEDTGLLDTWPARVESNQQAASRHQTLPDDTGGPPVGAFPSPEDIPKQAPEFATRRSPAADHGDMDRIKIDPVGADEVGQIHAVDGIEDGDSVQPRSALAAIIRLQSSEIERLALENDRLATRLNAVSQLHEDERNRRRNLDQKLQDASLWNDPPAPAFNAEEIRAATREEMSAEIKPVLTAILDLLETTLPRGAETAKPAAVAGETPVSASASLVAEVMGDLQRLPKILTRPIEELTSDPGEAGVEGAAPDRVAEPPARVLPRETRLRRPQPPRHPAQSNARPSALPSVFAWTNLFS